MPDRSTCAPCSLLFSTLCFALVGGAPEAGAQQVAGSVGVSLTVLQPVVTPVVRVTRFAVDPDGVAHVETARASADASQLVMMRISCPTTGYSSQVLTPGVVPAASPSSRLGYSLKIGRAPRSADTQPVVLRVEYLTVAGT